LELSVKRVLKKKGKKYILDVLLGTVPKVTSWASKFLTVIRTVLWRLGYIGLSAIITKVTDWILGGINSFVNSLVSKEYQDIIDVVTCFFSTGGVIAFMLDLFTDGYVNKIIKLI